MRGTWSVNLFIKCSEPCVSRAKVRSQSYFHLFFTSPPVHSVLSAWDCQPAKFFLFISKGEDFRTDHLWRRSGSAMFALSYWFRRCLEVNDTQHLMFLSYMSNKRMKGKVARGERQGAQGWGKLGGPRNIYTAFSFHPQPCRDWGVLLQMEDGLIFLMLPGSNEVLIHLL